MKHQEYIDYFNDINIPEKAYWLGFIYADGCIKGNTLHFGLSTKDRVILENFIKCIKTNSIIKDGHSKLKYKGKVKLYPASYLVIKSEKMIEDLKTYGCGGNKTFRIRLPKLDSQLLYDAFLLGFYDGDGFEKGSTICSGNIMFLEDIKSFFNIDNEIILKTNNYNKNWKCYVLNIGLALHYRICQSYEHSLQRKRKDPEVDRIRKLNSIINNKKSRKDKLRKKVQNIFNSMSLEYIQNKINKIGIRSFCKSIDTNRKIFKELCLENNIQIKKYSKIKKFVVTKDELERLINDYSYEKIGLMFGVTGKAIVKRAISLGIVLPKREIGYWAKKYANP